MRDLFPSERVSSFVAGSFAQSKATGKPHNSCVNGKPLKELIGATDEQIQEAIKSAEVGFAKMRAKTPYERAAYLEEIADLLRENRDSLANLITHEMGKPIAQARGEIDYTISYFRFFAAEATRTHGREIALPLPEKKCRTRFEPIGPCAIITPWNFPLAMAGRKIAPALAAGCSVIAKPSSSTPLSLLALGALAAKSNLPKEALSILIGDTEKISHALTHSPIIRKLSFTGSSATGKTLFTASAETLKKLTMELGGNAPFLIFADADLKVAVKEAIRAKFRNSGQTCICANRFLIDRKIYDNFCDHFVEEVKKLKIGDPLHEETDLSLHLHPTSQEKIPRHIHDAKLKGAETLLSATHPYEPEILKNANEEMLIFQEETFGPVAALMPFDREEEALHIANATPHGLASYLCTKDLKRAERVLSLLEAGIVGVNDGAPSSAHIPFGGIKASGFGREGGPTGIYEYLTEKTIVYGNLSS